MALEYNIGDKKFSLSYQELKALHEEYTTMSDDKFIRSLPEILHFVCIVSYLKEYGTFMFADDGLLHELVHLLHLGREETVGSLRDIRVLFDDLMALV